MSGSRFAQRLSRTKGSDLLVAALENEGVERIFGVPGEENLDVVESLRRSRIKLVLTRHEQAAAFMAATYGRLDRAGAAIPLRSQYDLRPLPAKASSSNRGRLPACACEGVLDLAAGDVRAFVRRIVPTTGQTPRCVPKPVNLSMSARRMRPPVGQRRHRCRRRRALHRRDRRLHAGKVLGCVTRPDLFALALSQAAVSVRSDRLAVRAGVWQG
jgi:Thiamine pyrophosphate enzyme, N-terminal TPP binding domain